ncbi:MAG: hypothetical protein IT558_05400 [Alphaproteobacteria bacterium]|nr:hypothetical protein [Alphaproteobacteria bacterium]
MNAYLKFILMTAAFGLFVQPAAAATVTTTTIVQQEDLPNTNKINFMAFDLNEDNVLSMREIGEKLFRLFDLDGNHSIDNIEFNKKGVMTIIPMEKTTFIQVDYNDDGSTDEAAVSYQDFIRDSHLMRFDENMDGLTPAEFIETGIEELDDDQDKLINLEEWKEAYMESLHLPVNEPERYKE